MVALIQSFHCPSACAATRLPPGRIELASPARLIAIALSFLEASKVTKDRVAANSLLRSSITRIQVPADPHICLLHEEKICAISPSTIQQSYEISAHIELRISVQPMARPISDLRISGRGERPPGPRSSSKDVLWGLHDAE
jgi:hypothetical protein